MESSSLISSRRNGLKGSVLIMQGFEIAVMKMHAPASEGGQVDLQLQRRIHIKFKPVDKVSSERNVWGHEGEAQVTCHHCGGPGHLATGCHFCDSVCHKCKGRGVSLWFTGAKSST